MLSSTVNLRTFGSETFANNGPHCDLVVFRTIFTTPHPELTSLQIRLDTCRCACDHSLGSPLHLDIIRTTPQIREITLSIRNTLEPFVVESLHRLFLAHSSHRESVSLTVWGSYTSTMGSLSTIIPADMAFLTLRNVGLDAHIVTHPFSKIFNHTKSLVVSKESSDSGGNESEESDDSDASSDHRRSRPVFAISRDAWPSLEEVSCTASLLTSFLPADTPPRARRPIRSVTLSCASYDFYDCSFDTDDVPSWPRLLSVLEHLHYSAVPIRKLEFIVEQMEISSLAQLLREHPQLESLLIMTDIHRPEPTPVRARARSTGTRC